VIALVSASGSGWTTAAIATIVAALVSGVISLCTFWAGGVRKEQERRRALHADALAALVSYREFAYVIRRRRAPIPGHEEIAGEERVRISEALRAVKRRSPYFSAWVRSEANADLADSYAALVGQTRRVAGGYMRDAWNAEPLGDDTGMNIADIDFAPLTEYESAYMKAVRRPLGFWPIAVPWSAK
jgi:hypothetical protein